MIMCCVITIDYQVSSSTLPACARDVPAASLTTRAVENAMCTLCMSVSLTILAVAGSWTRGAVTDAGGVDLSAVCAKPIHIGGDIC